MVTKLRNSHSLQFDSSVLAKIHMVTKPQISQDLTMISSVLAKIHMVTKPHTLSVLH